MPLSGQPPKPTALKILQGTFRKDRANPTEPTPAPSSIKAPSYLSAKEKKHWRATAAELIKMRVLTTADRTTLARYCELQVIYRDMKAAVPDDPKIIGTLLKVAIELRTLEVQFGLTPSSRTHIHAQPQQDNGENKLARFLKKA